MLYTKSKWHITFYFYQQKPDTALEFDIKDLKAQDSSNPIFYINYAYARINQVLQKPAKLTRYKSPWFGKPDEMHSTLAYEALSLDDVLIDALRVEFAKIPDFKNLSAQILHKFYNENRVW